MVSFNSNQIRVPKLETLYTEIEHFRSLLDNRVSEEVIHQFLATHSYFFNGILRLHGASPLYSKIKLGSDYEVDFAWFDTGSYGAEWRLVEIEAPTHSMFTKNGDPSQPLNHAIQQVRDWKDWVRSYHSYARDLMPHLDYPQCYVFIGREHELTDKTRKKLKQLNDESRVVEIHTLDWFVRNASSVATLLTGIGAEWTVPNEAYNHSDLRNKRPKQAFDWLTSYPPRKDSLRRRLEEKRGKSIEID